MGLLYRPSLWCSVRVEHLTVHDELNFETDPAIAELVKEVLAELVEFIGTELGLLCPLMAEGKVMDYWKK